MKISKEDVMLITNLYMSDVFGVLRLSATSPVSVPFKPESICKEVKHSLAFSILAC